MAHTQDAVVYDPATGLVIMAVIPDDDSQLAQAAFNPPGTQQALVPHVAGSDPIAAAIALYPQLNLTTALPSGQ